MVKLILVKANVIPNPANNIKYKNEFLEKARKLKYLIIGK